ncbi:MAG TPA: hypothetical protein VGF22_03550, partial [Acidimicrobiales bacterium]
MKSLTRARAVVIATGALIGLAAAVSPGAPATAASLSAGGFTTSGKAPKTAVAAGSEAALTAVVTSSTSRTVLVDLEVYSPAGVKVYQRAWDSQSLTANKAAKFPTTWAVPGATGAGTYVVKVGVFTPAWAQLLHWNDKAKTFKVTSTSPSTTTSTVASTTTTVPSGGLPALPAAWPRTFELGVSDSPGGAAAMKAV